MNSAVKAALASVLVIDDHPMVSRLVCEELAEAGYGATSAFDAAEARHTLRDRPVDLAIVSMASPPQRGLETIQELRSHHPHLKIVSASLDPSSYVTELARWAGADAHLRIPFPATELIRTVRRTLA